MPEFNVMQKITHLQKLIPLEKFLEDTFTHLYMQMPKQNKTNFKNKTNHSFSTW